MLVRLSTVLIIALLGCDGKIYAGPDGYLSVHPAANHDTYGMTVRIRANMQPDGKVKSTVEQYPCQCPEGWRCRVSQCVCRALNDGTGPHYVELLCKP